MWIADALRGQRFSGFVPLLSIDPERDDVPDKAGVYVVLRQSELPPVFLAESPCGERAGRPVPTVEQLADKWFDGCAVLYIGMTKRPLSKRLDEYREMGFGGKNHFGGRWLLQLADRAELVVCWRATETGKEAGAEETRLLTLFRDDWGTLPFANHKVGRTKP